MPKPKAIKTPSKPPEVIRPQPGPQETFLGSSAEIVVYGGAAGGGKSFALLLDPLRYLTTIPGFHGVIFRRTYSQVMMSGGLWDTAAAVYGKLGAVPRRNDLTWTFPPFNNTIRFGHMQHAGDERNYQGSQIPYIAFDELTHFSRAQFEYLVLSRGRSGCSVPSYCRASCNPEPGWVKTFLAPWVDEEYKGKRAQSGETRYFARVDGERAWVDRGHPHSKSLSFVRATLDDNKILLANNPNYRSSLENLPTVERARLLLGDWSIKRDGLVYPGWESCLVDHAPTNVNVGAIDWGWAHPFGAVWGHLDTNDILWITGCRRVSQATLSEHSDALPRGDIRWWCDPAGASNIAELRLAGHDAVPCKHLGSKPVMTGIDRVSERMRTGRLKILRCDETKPLIQELGSYAYDATRGGEAPIKLNDDVVDALRYLIVGIDRGRAIPVKPLSDQEIQAQLEADQAAEAERRRQEREEARARMFDDDDDRLWR